MLLLIGLMIATKLGLAGWWWFGAGVLFHFGVYAIVFKIWGLKGIGILVVVDTFAAYLLKKTLED